jgi:hypothetical protein
MALIKVFCNEIASRREELISERERAKKGMPYFRRRAFNLSFLLK